MRTTRSNQHRSAKSAVRNVTVVCLPVVCMPVAASAQDAPARLDALVRMVEQISSGMSDNVANAAITLLYTLAAIEFA